jgi:hypothetical protein
VPYIVGLGAACALAARRLNAGHDRDVARLRDRLHLTGMGLDAQRAPGAVRLSLGYNATTADVDTAAAALVASTTATMAVVRRPAADPRAVR